eukprot:3113173-Rhodomonas_salina.5
MVLYTQVSISSVRISEPSDNMSDDASLYTAQRRSELLLFMEAVLLFMKAVLLFMKAVLLFMEAVLLLFMEAVLPLTAVERRFGWWQPC